MPKKDIESSGNNEWETPTEFFNHWNDIFHFDRDVAANSNNAKVPLFISKEDNSLITPWGQRNWMNPPYGKPEYPCKPICTKKICQERGHHNAEYQPGLCDFVKRAYEQSLEGKLVVALIPSSRATEWWQNYVYNKACHIYDYPKRINFLQNGKVVKGVAFDPCIVIWGLHPKPVRGSLL